MQIAPAATLLATVAGSAARAGARVLRRLVRRDLQPLHRRVPGDPGDHLPDRRDHEPRHVGADADRHHRPRLHPDHRAYRPRRRARRGGPGLRPGGQAARRARAVHPVRRDPAEHRAADHRRGDRAARLRDLHARGHHASSASACQPPTPDWSVDITAGFQNLNDTFHDGYYWTVLFPGLAIISICVAVAMLADSLQQAFDR